MENAPVCACGKPIKKHAKTRSKAKICNSCAVTNFRRRQKQKAVELKGGRCASCGYKKSMRAMSFHHREKSEKEFAISVDGSTRSWERVVQELSKCDLLCANCHHEEHERSKPVLEDKRMTGKRLAVEWKGGSCLVCSYKKSLAGLQFHHLDPKKKDFDIGKKLKKNFNEIREELEKCVLLCANCHAEVHEGIIDTIILSKLEAERMRV